MRCEACALAWKLLAVVFLVAFFEHENGFPKVWRAKSPLETWSALARVTEKACPCALLVYPFPACARLPAPATLQTPGQGGHTFRLGTTQIKSCQGQQESRMKSSIQGESLTIGVGLPSPALCQEVVRVACRSDFRTRSSAAYFAQIPTQILHLHVHRLDSTIV